MNLTAVNISVFYQYPVSALYLPAGILAEIGSIEAFSSQNALSKYAGIYWKQNQSGDFEADDAKMSKEGNRYLLYYIMEASNSVRNWIPEYKSDFGKKHDEVKTHQYKCALALTSRKFVRQIFGLLAKNHLYSPDKVDKI